MERISIDTIKVIQVEILSSIDDFCKKHKLCYSLSSGTLIGAVRHQGYIPWDDDIDIMMPREDYDLFIKTFNGYCKHLSLIAPEIQKDYYAPYANVYDNRTLLTEGTNGHHGLDIGIKIDIFPIDKVPEDVSGYTRKLQLVRLLNYIMFIKRTNVISFKTTIFKILFGCIPYSFMQRIIRRIAVDKKCVDSKYVDNVVFNVYHKKRPRFLASIMENYIRLPFEGREFCVVKEYDKVLRKMYGDYMQLPPENQRVFQHNFEAFWIN